MLATILASYHSHAYGPLLLIVPVAVRRAASTALAAGLAAGGGEQHRLADLAELTVELELRCRTPITKRARRSSMAIDFG